jgi:hypothetical protein
MSILEYLLIYLLEDMDRLNIMILLIIIKEFKIAIIK